MKRFFLAFVLCVGFVLIFWLGVPLPKNHQTTWEFYDREGFLLYKEDPIKTSVQTKNVFLQESLIALEDENFYHHAGVDIKAVLRAGHDNWKHGRVVSGASTITMQLARLKFLMHHKRNFNYKIKQSFYALKLEIWYSKKELLQEYLALVPLGQGTVGVEAAADYYFGKTAAQLSKGEVVALLSTIPNPSAFNPVSFPKQAQKRQQLIFKRLQSKKVLNKDEYRFWSQQKLVVRPKKNNVITAPHFVLWLQAQLKQQAWVKPGVLKVYTTLDKKAYKKSLSILQQNLKRLGPEKKLTNGAVVVLDKSNQVRVMVGSANFFDPNIDGAVNMATAPRQSGSTLKPFLYALAISNGRSPLEALFDQKTIFASGYLPRNFDVLQENGPVRFREALANSYNIAAVDLLQQVTVENFYSFLQTIGLNLSGAPSVYGLSLVLGSAETSLLNLTAAYSVFTHQGSLHSLQTVLRVTDQKDKTLWEPKFNAVQKIFSLNTAEWGQHVLSDKVARWKNFGQGNSLELPFASGAKTGTSQGFKDNWVLGFSPLYTVGVWMGNADGSPMQASSGLQGAGPVWQGIMQSLHATLTVPDFAYFGTRKLETVCRRPKALSCTEEVTAFVLPQELEKNKITAVKNPAETFEIFYPSDVDVFAAGSDVLLQWRGTRNVDFYVNEKAVDGPIFSDLGVGRYVFKIKSHTGQTDSVVINVEKLD